MLAGRTLRAGVRLADVPVWLAECEAHATRHGYRHELAHARLTRAIYERISGRPESALPMLDAVLLIFRQAGDLRCVARTLIELAARQSGLDQAEAVDLLLQALPSAAMTEEAVRRTVLTKLVGAADAAGDLVLAARCLGALQALRQPGRPGSPAQDCDVDQALARRLTHGAYATYFGEGLAGGTALLTTLYPR